MTGKSKLKRLNKRKKNKKQFINNVECINTSMIKHRPVFRGYVHALGLLITIGILIIILPHLNLFSEVTNNDSYVLLYFLIQILQFGLSSFYHVNYLEYKLRQIIRLFDHSSIFLLISATQTIIFKIMIDKTVDGELINDIGRLIKISWFIATVGILKLFVCSKMFNFIDITIYIFHGLIVVFSIRSMFLLETRDRLLCMAGGLFYIVGGIIKGFKRPNNGVFGYHEIFHVFTLLGNYSFMIVVLCNKFY